MCWATWLGHSSSHRCLSCADGFRCITPATSSFGLYNCLLCCSKSPSVDCLPASRRYCWCLSTNMGLEQLVSSEVWIYTSTELSAHHPHPSRYGDQRKACGCHGDLGHGSHPGSSHWTCRRWILGGSRRMALGFLGDCDHCKTLRNRSRPFSRTMAHTSIDWSYHHRNWSRLSGILRARPPETQGVSSPKGNWKPKSSIHLRHH